MSFTTLISSFKTFFFYAIVFFSVVVSAQAQTGLVANWKFDEGTGTSVADDSGNNLTGTFSTTGNGSLTWGSSTAFIGAASALTFEGTNSDYAYVNVPDNSMLFNSMNAKMTIEAWIYQSDNADNTIIDRGNYSFLLQANGTGNANPGLKFYNPAIGWIYSSTALPVNEWVHVSMTWDDSSDTLIFYKNGVETDTFTGLESLISTAGPVNIGRQDPNDCHCNLMNGKIDELRLWNVVRSQAEISANMNSTLAPVISSFTPTSAGIGATITLTGTNFTGTTAVSFGGTAASSFTVVSSTSITAVLASGSSGSISVTSNNSTATKTGFTYLSSNTDLSALSISDGSLSPNFASGTTAYTANVNNATTSITVTPTQADVNASITVNGIPVVSGAASSAIALNIGSNTITTIVTAQNGATKTYTLTVTREMTPPGNALNFDGSNDYVNVGDVIEGFTTITFEAWVNHSTSGNWDEICSKAYVNSFGITGDDRLWFHLGNGAAWFAGGGVASNSTIPSNKWTHVAATWDGTTAKLYINGVLDNTAAHTGTVGSNSNLRGIGGYVWEISLFSGKIDELRIYDSVLSQSAIAADMVSTSVTSANLIGYYNFDTISGNILIDKSTSNFNGTVINGPTLVESYAMVVPITTAATSISTTGFTANWSAPTIGTVTNYILDVATDIGFTAPVSGSPFNIAAPTLTKHITGLASGSAYFYRVRADKTSVSGEGASSGIISESTAAAVLSPFVTTWQTDGSNNTTIPLTGSGYDFNVDWGDGTVETKTGSPGNISHTYTSSGIKTVSITPNTPTGFPRIYVNNFSLRNNLMTIESWGSGQWGTSVDRAFYGASNLEVNATDTPDFSATTNFQIMFYNCTTVTGTNGFANWTLNTNPAASVSFSNMFNGATQFDGVISNWDVSRVTTFENMFSNAQKFNQDISSWNVANVTNMSSMFYNAKVFAQDISSWNVGNVTNMSYMFRNADAFNFNISGWDVSSVTNMTYMFDGNNVFNQDLSNWDVSNVTNMLGMFREMPVFNAPLVWGTKTGNVTTMQEMFRGSPQFNQDINGWDVSKVTTTNLMFYAATAFNQSLNSWNVSNLVNASNMFGNATSFNGTISSWVFTTDPTKNVNASSMFSNAQKFNQDISSWNVANVTNMSSMFYNAKVFAQDISSWNVGNVTNMSYMFRNADAFNFNISGWDVSSVTNMTYMFDGNNVFNQDLSNWDVSNVTNMLGMFREMPVFNAPLVWGTKTGNVTTMREMFRGSPQFNQDINGWDVSKVTTTYFMFYAATAFNQPLNSWNVSNLVNAGYMFVSATSFNQNISSWDISKVTNLQNFLVNGKLSRTNYDALLLGWSTLDAGETLVPINLNAHFGNSKYSDTPTVLTARNTTLIANKAWTITDGGTDADIVLPEIASTSLASDNTNISITFSENVYLTDVASAALETTSFLFSISGGTATLNTTTPSSISTSDNLTFVLDIDMSGAPDGTEMLTVTPVLNGIFDVSGNAASATQINNSAQLNDLSGPVITGPSSETGLNSAISSNENINAVYTFSVNETVTWSLGTSSDGALFSIDGSGSLVFTNAPDYEIPSSSLNSNTYTVEIIATDIANNISTQILTVTITDVLSATLTNFSNEAKHYFDASYTIAPPISNSSGLLTYTSSDLAVAIISGSTVTITGAGTAIITATQAMDATYDSGSLTSVLTVTAISVLTKNGGISTTNPNYVNKNGGIGKGIALSRNGTILAVKTPPPAIGDLREGGVVFWVDGNGGGLVCALEDQSTAIKWGTNGIETGAEATSIGSGAANTAAIISVQGGDQSSYVAGISNTYDGGGYKDWFLPSEDEVKEMYLNRVAVNNTLEQRGAVLVGGSIQQYWTSTQSSGNNNWAVGFSFIGGTMSNFNKSDTRPSMRAVRAF
jgi:surface protein